MATRAEYNAARRAAHLERATARQVARAAAAASRSSVSSVRHTFSLTFDVAQVLQFFAGMHGELPYATAKALNQIALNVQKELRDTLHKDLTIRNKWASKGIQTRLAKPPKGAPIGSIQAEVGSVDEFMARQALGGKREPGPADVQAVPVGARTPASTITSRGKWPAALLRRKGYFVATTKNGNVGVFRRTTPKRLPVTLMYWLHRGPVDVPQRWHFADVAQDLANREGELIAREIIRKEVDRLLASPAAGGAAGAATLRRLANWRTAGARAGL